MKNESVYVLKNYDKVVVNLKEVLAKRDISRGKLSKMVALNYDLVNRYYNNKVSRVDLEVIARMCYVLNCDISEMLVFEKRKRRH